MTDTILIAKAVLITILCFVAFILIINKIFGLDDGFQREEEQDLTGLDFLTYFDPLDMGLYKHVSSITTYDIHNKVVSKIYKLRSSLRIGNEEIMSSIVERDRLAVISMESHHTKEAYEYHRRVKEFEGSKK